jgi:ubiquitin carboxyl-terminal hydrolase 5/13
LDENGLYIDLISLLGFSREFVELNYRKTGHRVYLQIERTRVPRDEPASKRARATVLGVGVEGGFDANAGEQYDERDAYRIVVLPSFASIAYPNEQVLPMRVSDAARAVLESTGAARSEEIAAFVLDEERPVSKHAESLVQLQNGKRVPPAGWHCEAAGCDQREGLWLNLSDGALMCGRRNWDGSGGRGHGLEYYQRTGYPLAVKLGTVQADVDAIDVYSYAEDSMVRDPYLTRHLAHFGIDVASMKKSEKSMAELTVDAQYLLDAAIIEQHGVTLLGAPFNGLRNLGSSCYLNAVLQMIFSTDIALDRFVLSIIRECILSRIPPSQILQSVRNDTDQRSVGCAVGFR